jgi:hypothetical protein
MNASAIAISCQRGQKRATLGANSRLIPDFAVEIEAEGRTTWEPGAAKTALRDLKLKIPNGKFEHL